MLLVLTKSQRLCSRTFFSPRQRHSSQAIGRLELAYARSVVDHCGVPLIVGLCIFDIIMLSPRRSLELNVRVFQAKRDTQKLVGYVREVLAKSWNNGS